MTSIASPPDPPRPPIVVRKRHHRWDDRELDRHFVGGDLLLSHIAAMASSVFPEGEAFFIRSVRHYRPAISDPDLLDRIRGFAGQEAVHSREHARFNERLAELGYPTRHLDHRTRLGLRIVDRLFPPELKLAVTVALEHVTATLADAILEHPDVRSLFTDPQVRELVVWHATEEAEHRSVAFDVYRAVGGREWIRRWVFRVMWFTTGLDLGTALLTSLAFDPDGRRPGRVRASWRRLRSSPFAGLGLGRQLARYLEPDFRP